MKSLFNIFKKKKEVITEPIHLKSYITEGKKIWNISDIIPIKVQDHCGENKVYGWVVEYKINDHNWSNCNNKIYASLRTALEASVSMSKNYFQNYELRIVAIYKMTGPEFRDHKIEMLLSDSNIKPNFIHTEVKAWKVKENCEVFYEGSNKKFEYKKGTLFIQNENGNIFTIKNPTTKLGFNDEYMLFNDLIIKDLVEEVNIDDEKWAMPHLCKELKQKIKK